MEKTTMTMRTVRQRGSALIISLLILIVMTLIGLTGISSSSLEEKMAGNTRDQALAFQAAEAALRAGEDYFNNTIVSVNTAFNGETAWLYPQNSVPDLLSDDTWDTAESYAGDIAGVQDQPKYIIELLGRVTDPSSNITIENYAGSNGAGDIIAARVTARAVGGTGNTVAILQSNFSKRL
jgi:type IV pilus assembly protein PilX